MPRTDKGAMLAPFLIYMVVSIPSSESSYEISAAEFPAQPDGSADDSAHWY